MAITFGGLATGLDTNGIIDGLMEVERIPLTRLQADQTWLNSRLTAFKEFDTYLNNFHSNATSLADRDQYFHRTASIATDEFFTASITDDALANTTYNVEVRALAQVQKTHIDASFSSEDNLIFSQGNIDITVDGTLHSIAIGVGETSLEAVTSAINDADIGVVANIINDGSDTNPYRMTLTGTDVATSFTIDASGIAGTESIGTVTNYQEATSASVVVDGITITSDSNTITDAIEGMTLNLIKSEEGTDTSISIKNDNSVIATNINAFVKSYNDAVAFVTKQSTYGDSAGGILGGDSGLNSVKRNFQNLLTTQITTSSSFKALSQLGLQTQKDGTLTLDSDELNKAIETDLDGVISLLAGEEGGSGGIASRFEDYLDSLTDSTQGLYAGREQSITSNLKRIDDSITLMEMRLEKREENLRNQFNTMEQLISVLNSQGDYLSQQLESISQIGKD